MSKENYILPKTERSVNRIIMSVSNFFEITSLCFSGVYVIYTVIRIFVMNNMLVLNLMLAGITTVLTGLYFFSVLSKKEINSRIKFVLAILRRLVCCMITGVIFMGLFKEIDSLMPYRILFALFCGIGLFMTIIGDIFNATVPKWANEILTSFKQDIDISGLASRSFGQIKDAVVKNDSIKEVGTKGAFFVGVTLALSSLKKFVHKKNKNNFKCK